MAQRHTDEQINFFGLEIELWRIAESPVAPKFNIVCQPNDWSRTVRSAAAQAWQSSELNRTQLRFWTAFRDYMEANHSQVRCQKPAEQQWMNHALGRSDFCLASVISTWNSITHKQGPEIRVELVLMGKQAKEQYAELEKRRAEIERAVGVPIIWHNPPNKKQSKIYVRKDADFLDEAQWPEQQRWLKEHLELFNRVFVRL